MNKMFQSIVVATDRYRAGIETYENTIALAKKLHASLRMVYVVDLMELKTTIHGCDPYGPGAAGIFLVRGTPREKALVAEGREGLKRFEAACEHASIKHNGEVFVGAAEKIWGKKGSPCDLLTIFPVKSDFEYFRTWFSNIFWRIATRSKTPVLVFRRELLPKQKAALFHTGYRSPTLRTVKRAAEFCSTFEMSLTVYWYKSSLINPHLDKKCQAFFQQRQIPAIFKEKPALKVLDREVNKFGSELDSTSLLVFDSSFCKGLWFQKHRCLLDQLILKSNHSILLCP